MIYGIDLGTTYSAITCVEEDGKPVILVNNECERKTPSVVFFQPPYEENGKIEVMVGRTAKEAGSTDPDNVVAFIKRQMGSDWKKEFFGMEFTPEMISAEILKKMVKDAKNVHQREVKDVVITYPAYFSSEEKSATKAAGELAGLNVISFLEEPVAAALHYGLNQLEENRTAIVYDLGGRTFDVSVVTIKNGNLNIVCSDGDHQLGGKLWDERLVYLIANKFAEQVGVDVQEILGDKETCYDLTLLAEKAKIHLSNGPVWKGRVSFEGNRVTVEIIREEFDENTKDILARTEEFTQGMIDMAKRKGIEKINDFLLVGGSTKMPQVMAMVKEKFASQVENEPNIFEPDEAVAKGAAIFGNVFGHARVNQSTNYGIRVNDNNPFIFNMISSFNKEASRTEEFLIPEDNLDFILIEIFESNTSSTFTPVSAAKKIGYLTVKISNKLSKGSKIYLNLTLQNDLLKASVFDASDNLLSKAEFEVVPISRNKNPFDLDGDIII